MAVSAYRESGLRIGWATMTPLPTFGRLPCGTAELPPGRAAVIWMLMAWLCSASGEYRPVDTATVGRGACIKAEQGLRGEGIIARCHKRPAPDASAPSV